jgi:DegV family protein with EDD domain
VRIVTDSTADIPASLAVELGITVVPCIIYVGQEALRDGVDLTPEAFFDKLARSSELPRTSQPPVASFVAAYRNLLEADGCAGIVSIHVALTLSGTLNAAWAAAQTLEDPTQVRVVDSGQLSMGLGWAVVEAARMARAGATLDEIQHNSQVLLARLRTVAMIDTLENLRKGGRISVISAAFGTAFQIKPLLAVRNGEVSVLDRVRTRSKALAHIEALVRGWGPLAEMAVLHIGAPELAQELAANLRDLVPTERIVIGPAGPALATHLGLGAVGVCALQA